MPVKEGEWADFLLGVTQSEKLVMGRGGESDVARRESELVICYVLIFFFIALTSLLATISFLTYLLNDKMEIKPVEY